MSSFQRFLSTQMWDLELLKVSCPQNRGVLIERLHCVYIHTSLAIVAVSTVEYVLLRSQTVLTDG